MTSYGVVSSQSQQRELDFDPEELLVDQLRQECKLRELRSSGPKVELVARLRQAIKDKPDLPTKRLTSAAPRKKRAMNKREPERSEFATEREYKDAWHKWRIERDQNNESVKRSREAARERKEQNELLCQRRMKENSALKSQVATLQANILTLTQFLRQSEPDPETHARVKQIIQTVHSSTSAVPDAARASEAATLEDTLLDLDGLGSSTASTDVAAFADPSAMSSGDHATVPLSFASDDPSQLS
eukprot:m.91743 g.91743  ORF g.91743 m.91743 type:complete len:245 (-) comp12959_c0_seq1:1225-1959(-)